MKAGFFLTAAALVLASGTLAMAAPETKDGVKVNQPEIRREGGGERRQKLNAMELKPFPAELWSTLSDWQGGEAPTAESLKGKVVLIITWSEWVPVSQQAITRVNDLIAKHGTDGLVVIGVHDAKKYDEAGKFLAEKGIKVLSAKDSDGKFRAGLLSDGDPDAYIIDRAGNLRFADIESDVVAKGVDLALAETAEAATALPQQLADAAKKVKDETGKTKKVADVWTPEEIGKTKGKFTPPDGALYEKALWPKKNSDEGVSPHANNIQGQQLPDEVKTMANVTWLSDKPEHWAGKVIIIDFWATWCGPCKRSKPLINDLQEKNLDDLLVVAVSGYNDPKPQVQRFLRGEESPLAQAYDNEEKIGKALNLRAYPTCLVMSTDGVVRWIGNPLQPEFRSIVEEIIRLDPGVAARQRSEKAAIKAKGG